MVSFVSILFFGFFLGMRHATDADHVVAVTTIVCRERTLRAAAPIGAIWGLGHMVTILVVGGAIILFGIVIPPRLGLTMELSVALMLILLGGLNLSAFLRQTSIITREEAHTHADDAGQHVHAQDAGHEAVDATMAQIDRRLGRFGAYRLLRPLIIGVVHGLAGSAAVALLVLGTIRDPAWAIGYLVVFGVGTIAGMLLITLALALPFAVVVRRAERLHRALTFGSGLVSVLFGLFLVYHIGFVDGLFTAHPSWTPG